MKNSEGEFSQAAEFSVMQRLLALFVIDGKKQRDQIRMLALAGMGRNQIAELIGTTPGTVSVEISTMKKERARRGKKGR